MERLDIQKTYKIYIGGQFPRTESGRYYPLQVKGKVIANVCLSSRKDLRNAVVAARGAFGGWSSKTAYNRSQILYRIAEMLEGRRDQFIAELRTLGSSQAKAASEVAQSIDTLVYYAGWCDKFQQVFSSVNPVAGSYFNFSTPEAVGVVSIIAPEDAGLLGLVASIAPVIAGGNTCVVLSSNSNPLSAISFAEVVNSSDVPGGVVNILTGDLKELYEHFASHMDINSFIWARENSDLKKKAEELSVMNLKRFITWKPLDIKNENGDPYMLMDTQEIKTTWHPIENIGGAKAGY
jgi:acyl-CoA reductase-like NAD-dependent aldehyde dehydrogenase